MFIELQNEGYTEINMVGINGFHYIDNDYHCMICDTPDECSSCDEERILPWVQDIDDDDNDFWFNSGVVVSTVEGPIELGDSQAIRIERSISRPQRLTKAISHNVTKSPPSERS